MQNALIIFVENAGKRIQSNDFAKEIGEEKSEQVHRFLAQHIRDISLGCNCSHFVFYSTYIHIGDLFEDDRFTKFVQEGEHAPQKIRNAFEKVIHLGCEQVCLVSTDCYELETDMLEQAFDKLHSADVVLGPGSNGSFYLLGINSLHKDVLAKLDDLTSTSYDQLKSLIAGSGLKLSELPTLTVVSTIKEIMQTNILTHIKEGDLE